MGERGREREKLPMEIAHPDVDFGFEEHILVELGRYVKARGAGKIDHFQAFSELAAELVHRHCEVQSDGTVRVPTNFAIKIAALDDGASPDLYEGPDYGSFVRAKRQPVPGEVILTMPGAQFIRKFYRVSPVPAAH